MWAGTSVEFVKDLPEAGELVARLWQECEAARVAPAAYGDPDDNVK